MLKKLLKFSENVISGKAYTDEKALIVLARDGSGRSDIILSFLCGFLASCGGNVIMLGCADKKTLKNNLKKYNADFAFYITDKIISLKHNGEEAVEAVKLSGFFNKNCGEILDLRVLHSNMRNIIMD